MAVRARDRPDGAESLDRVDRLIDREDRGDAFVLEDEREIEFFIPPVCPDLFTPDSLDRDFPVIPADRNLRVELDSPVEE